MRLVIAGFTVAFTTGAARVSGPQAEWASHGAAAGPANVAGGEKDALTAAVFSLEKSIADVRTLPRFRYVVCPDGQNKGPRERFSTRPILDGGRRSPVPRHRPGR